MAYSKKQLTDLLVGSQEAAEILGVTSSTVSAYLARGQMLPPLLTLACGPLWLRSDLERWQVKRLDRDAARRSARA